VEQRQRMNTAQQQSQPDNSNRVIGRMVMKERALHTRAVQRSMTRIASIALTPPKAMRFRPSEMF
jgi:hypothetical protein